MSAKALAEPAMDQSSTIPLEPITCTIKQAAAASGLGQWSIWKLIKDGHLEAVRIGGRTLVNIASLKRLLKNGQSANSSKRGVNMRAKNSETHETEAPQ